MREVIGGRPERTKVIKISQYSINQTTMYGGELRDF